MFVLRMFINEPQQQGGVEEWWTGSRRSLGRSFFIWTVVTRVKIVAHSRVKDRTNTDKSCI